MVFSLSPFSHLRLHAECSVQHHFSCDVFTVSFFHIRLQNVRYGTTFCCDVLTVSFFYLRLQNVRYGTTFCCDVLTVSFFYLRLQNVRYGTTFFCDVLTVSFFHLRKKKNHYGTIFCCDVLTVSFFHLRLQNVRYGTTFCCDVLTVSFFHLRLQNVRYVGRSPLFLWCSHCLLFPTSAYMQNVRYSTTFPVMFSPHLFSTSAYRMFTTSIDHHSSSAVLTISFFHLRLQNIRYVTTSVLCAFTVLFSLFLPSPPTEHSVRHHFCAVRVYCAVLTISFFHLRLQNIRYVTTSVLCAFAELFSLSHSSISVGRRFGTSPLLCCARLLCYSHFLFLPSPPAERAVRRSPLFLCCS